MWWNCGLSDQNYWPSTLNFIFVSTTPCRNVVFSFWSGKISGLKLLSWDWDRNRQNKVVPSYTAFRIQVIPVINSNEAWRDFIFCKWHSINSLAIARSSDFLRPSLGLGLEVLREVERKARVICLISGQIWSPHLESPRWAPAGSVWKQTANVFFYL